MLVTFESSYQYRVSYDYICFMCALLAYGSLDTMASTYRIRQMAYQLWEYI